LTSTYDPAGIWFSLVPRLKLDSFVRAKSIEKTLVLLPAGILITE